MKAAAIGIVRNAVDLEPLIALHHWLIGVDSGRVVSRGRYYSSNRQGLCASNQSNRRS